MSNESEKAKEVRFLAYCTLEINDSRTNTALPADRTTAVMSSSTLQQNHLNNISLRSPVSGLRSRLLRRVGCLFRLFFLGKFLHDVFEVLENASVSIRKYFNAQVPIFPSKQWLHEMWLSRTYVQESPSWDQYAHYFLETSVDIFPDVVWWIPHRTMEPIGLIEVSISQSMAESFRL